MKLYVYDHCPYCVRAMMIFGLKNLPVQLEILLNDDEDTPVGLVGKKVVPILIKDDGKAMPESLDIVQYVDQYDGQPILKRDVRPEIETLLSEMTSYANYLLMPRFVKLSVPEFATESAIAYFTKKKTDYVGDFDIHWQKTEEYLIRLQADLQKLESLILGEHSLNQQLSLEDIFVFPILRNLTCVKELALPTKVQHYVNTMSKLSKVNLYTEQAI